MFANAMAKAATVEETSGSEEASGEWTLQGFGPMTRVTTSFGEVHAITLRERDRIRCEMGGNEEVTDVDQVKLDEDFLETMPDAQPILIQAGALGRGLPKVDIMVSPNQPIGFGIQRCETGFRPARDFLGQRGVSRASETLVTYTRFRCTRAVEVRMEGLWTRVEG